MKDTQQKLNFDTSLGGVYWGRSVLDKDSHWKKETEFRNQALKYIPLSDEALKMVNDYPELMLFPDYYSSTQENMTRTLNKLHGNYFFSINLGSPENLNGIAWIGGYSGAEVEEFVKDILNNPIWLFLFSNKFWEGGSYSTYRLYESPSITLVRLEEHNVFGHFCPMNVLYKNRVQIPIDNGDKYYGKKLDDGRRRPFVGIPFIIKLLIGTLDKRNEAIKTYFWEFEGELPETINHVKRMYGNMLKYNFPNASFKISHKAGTNNIIVAYNGANSNQIIGIRDFMGCLFKNHLYHYYDKGSNNAKKSLFPYKYMVPLDFVEDKSLRLPSAAETRQRILFKVQGLRKKLELLNESNKKTLPLPENF